MVPLTTKFKVVTPPTEEPVSLAEAKAHLRVDGSDEDALIASLISAARSMCEDLAGRAFVTQTLCAYPDGFPDCGGAIKVPRPMLQSITSVEYYDVDGALQTLATTVYEADAIAEPGEVVLLPGQTWPDVQAERRNAVRITYVAGYGNAAAVDARAKQAMLMLIAHWYENREATITGGMNTAVSAEIQLGLNALLGQLWHGHLV